MKLTKSQLKQIIKEELEKEIESLDESIAGYLGVGTGEEARGTSEYIMNQAVKVIHNDEELYNKVKKVLIDKEGREQAKEMLRNLHVKPGMDLETIWETIKMHDSVYTMMSFIAGSTAMMGILDEYAKGHPLRISAHLALIAATSAVLATVKSLEGPLDPMQHSLERPRLGAPPAPPNDPVE